MAIMGGSGYFKVNDQVHKEAVARIQYNLEKRMLLVWKQSHTHKSKQLLL